MLSHVSKQVTFAILVCTTFTDRGRRLFVRGRLTSDVHAESYGGIAGGAFRRHERRYVEPEQS